jgi:hypothetical protein
VPAGTPSARLPEVAKVVARFLPSRDAGTSAAKFVNAAASSSWRSAAEQFTSSTPAHAEVYTRAAGQTRLATGRHELARPALVKRYGAGTPGPMGVAGRSGGTADSVADQCVRQDSSAEKTRLTPRKSRKLSHFARAVPAPDHATGPVSRTYRLRDFRPYRGSLRALHG